MDPHKYTCLIFSRAQSSSTSGVRIIGHHMQKKEKKLKPHLTRYIQISSKKMDHRLKGKM